MMTNLFTLSGINTKKEDLDLSGYDFDTKELQQLSKKLEHNFIRSLDLSNNSFSSKSLNTILKALQKNKNLEILDLSENGLTGKGMKEFSKILKKHKSLTTLDLSQNTIQSEGLIFILEGLSQNSSLENLYVSNCGITDDGAKQLSIYLSNKIQKLTRLDISGNTDITELGMELIFNSMKTNTMLKVLKISEIRLDGCIEELLDMLKSNDTLIQLTANNCSLNYKDLYDLMKIIENKKNLKILHLNENDAYFDNSEYFGNSSTIFTPQDNYFNFSSCIENNKSLKVLNVQHSFRSIDMKSFESIWKGIEKNDTLEVFNIGDHGPYQFNFDHSLEQNKSLKAVKLIGHQLTDNFASIIENNQTIEILDISTCHIPNMPPIMSALAKNQKLIEWKIPHDVEKKGLLELMKSLQVNTHLERLTIGTLPLNSRWSLRWLTNLAEYDDDEVDFIFYSLLKNQVLEEFSYEFPNSVTKRQILNKIKNTIMRQNAVCKDIAKNFSGMKNVSTLNDISFNYVYMGYKRNNENEEERVHKK